MNQNTENMSLKEALVYIKALKDENERLKQQNANLTEQIIRNQKKMYGKSSEQIRYIYDSEQLSFFNEAEQEYSASAPEPTKETLVASHTRKANALRLKSQKILNTKK